MNDIYCLYVIYVLHVKYAIYVICNICDSMSSMSMLTHMAYMKYIAYITSVFSLSAKSYDDQFFQNQFLKKMTLAQQSCANAAMLRWTVVPEVENRRAE